MIRTTYSPKGAGGATSGRKEGAASVQILSSQLNELTIEERSSALHDIHGVSDEKLDETPNMIQDKVQQMTLALNLSISNQRADNVWAYRKAMELSREYVEGLKIGFLRVMHYDSKEAAARMIRFFSRKMDLFGEETLVCDIEFKDLTEYEQEALRKGLVQLLPIRNRAGRPVVFINGKVNALYPVTNTVVSVFMNG
jgi:hypothetical protein